MMPSSVECTHQLSPEGLQARPELISAARESTQSCSPVTAIACISRNIDSAANQAPSLLSHGIQAGTNPRMFRTQNAWK